MASVPAQEKLCTCQWGSETVSGECHGQTFSFIDTYFEECDYCRSNEEQGERVYAILYDLAEISFLRLLPDYPVCQKPLFEVA